jgi:hypothetical protein
MKGHFSCSLAATVFVALAAALPSASAADFPRVATVEAQPLLAQLKRLRDALDAIGEPLPATVSTALGRLANEKDDAKVAADVQRLLDPLCALAVEFTAADRARAVATDKPLELVEQGWRAYLVKVCNPAHLTRAVRYDSPSAKPVPNSPAELVNARWLDLAEYTGQPLLPALSGLDLEYRVLQVYTRDRGERTADIRVWAGPALNLRLGQLPRETPPPAAAATVTLKVVGKPSRDVGFAVREADGTPCMAAFEIRDTAGRVYPFQLKRLAPDFYFHPQVYRSTGETVRLPAGKYTVKCSRGPESVPETKTVEVGDAPVTITYQVKRWIDPAKSGWWSGDHHIHAAGCQHYENPTEGVHPQDMMRHCLGEDLKVGACLTWGPCFDYQKRFFSGRPDDVSTPPYLLRYDVEVSGFGSHQSGHLCLLRLKEQMYPGGQSKDHWPTLGLNTLRWAKRQGAVCGPAHSGNGLTQFTDDRVAGGKEGPVPPGGRNEAGLPLPTFRIPRYNGIGANEFVVDITHEVPGPDEKLVPAVDFISTMDTDRTAELNMWYHALNCGFRARASGESDFPCIYGQRVGVGRIYVKLDGPPDYDRWCQGIADGRSYVSDGTCHLMGLTASAGAKAAEMGVAGSELALVEPARLTLKARAAARRDMNQPVDVELIVNGYPVAKQQVPGDGQDREVTFTADIARSSWVAVRVFPSAHTNPIFVTVGGKPIRASKADVEWCLKGVDQCWAQKRQTYAASELAAAEAAYNHARTVYRRLLAEVP